MNKLQLLQWLKGYGQAHLIDTYDVLTPEEQFILSRQITHSGIDFPRLNTILRENLKALDNDGVYITETKREINCLEPPLQESIFSDDAVKSVNSGGIRHLKRLGLVVITKKEASVPLLSGGSRTRLGISTPKGSTRAGAEVGGG
ncbi:unnamed protein product [Phytomonas sp. Hart1]|nr:unnamed protein product [Phytomonas sp. Hart1]|eukprot:CCW72066.1 unnamed protein product [Phytomonas sp. isolate Hart1]